MIAVDTELLAAARQISTLARMHADAIEKGACLTQEVVDAITDAGIFAMTLPKNFGGREVDPITNFLVVEELSKADGSVGWCAMIGSGTANYVAASLPDGPLEAMLRTKPRSRFAGMVAPMGIARREGDGYRITGRWSFGSGCLHSDWIASGCMIDEGGGLRMRSGRPEWVTAIFRREDCETIPTWNTTGLRGSGSHDYAVTDAFVPRERVFSQVDDARRASSPIYTFPALYVVNMPAVPLGIAQHALEAFIAGPETWGGADMRPIARPPRADDSLVQSQLARAQALIGSARAYIIDVVGRAWHELQKGRTLTLQERGEYRLAMLQAFHASAEAIDLLYDAGGAISVYTCNPIDRCFRDLHTIKQHITGSVHSLKLCGQLLLDRDPNVFLF